MTSNFSFPLFTSSVVFDLEPLYAPLYHVPLLLLLRLTSPTKAPSCQMSGSASPGPAQSRILLLYFLLEIVTLLLIRPPNIILKNGCAFVHQPNFRNLSSP